MKYVGINNQNQIRAIIGRDELQYEEDDFFRQLDRDLAFISISDPRKDFIKTDGYFHDELFLKFWDVEEQIGEYLPLSSEQGLEIYNFIKKNKDKTFLINCEAGVSRSAGIGLAIEYLFRDKYLYPKWEHFPSKVLQHWRYEPNMTVFNRIVCHDN